MSFWKNLTILQRENAVESHANVQEPEGTEELSDFLGLRAVQESEAAKDILEMRVDLEREALLV